MSTKKKKSSRKPKPEAETPKKETAGAPSKYKEEYAQELIDYFSIPPYETKQRTVMIKGIPRDIDVIEPNDFPSLAGFAIKIGVHRDTLHEWANATNEDGSLKHPEFNNACKIAKDYQENYCLVNGISGKTKEQFTQFVMINVLNYRNKAKDEAPETIVNNTFEKKLSNEELDAMIAELAKQYQGKTK